MLNTLFHLDENQTNVRTELFAGLTTFLTMAYIIFVNPDILAAAGMDKNAVFVATCIAAAAGTLIMGIYANYPIALAPGMGLNAFFAFAGRQGDGGQLANCPGRGVLLRHAVPVAQRPAGPRLDHKQHSAVPKTGDCGRNWSVSGLYRSQKCRDRGRPPATFVTVGKIDQPAGLCWRFSALSS